MNFNELTIKETILKGISKMDYTEMTEIQAQVIPLALEKKDIIGQAPTGTGKTIAFAIPILEELDETSDKIQAVIMSPTRELAIQITNEINTVASQMKGVKALTLYGGEFIDKQIYALKKCPQIIVATPGRLLDHLRRKTVKLNNVRMVILDEADEMLNMGFLEDITSILESINADHQTMLFSATFSKDIEGIATRFMNRPTKLLVSNGSLTVDQITQKYILCNAKDKIEIMSRIIEINEYKIVMVFCNTKKGVDEVTSDLLTRGFLAEALHGDMKQMQRDRVMARFREGTIGILVASDVAARGLDVENVDVVFNYDLPTDDEYYIHRIGRTGRAQKLGLSVSLITKSERYRLNSIMKYAKVNVEKMEVPTLDKVVKVRTKRILDRAMELAKEKDNFENVDYETNRYISIIDKQIRKYEDFDKDLLIRGLMNIIISADSRNSDIDEIKEEVETRRKRRDNSANGVRMFITIGRKDEIRIYTITDMLIKNTNLTNDEINNIDLCDNFSFFEVPENKVETVLALSGELRYKGRTLNIEKANSSKSKSSKNTINGRRELNKSSRTKSPERRNRINKRK